MGDRGAMYVRFREGEQALDLGVYKGLIDNCANHEALQADPIASPIMGCDSPQRAEP